MKVQVKKRLDGFCNRIIATVFTPWPNAHGLIASNVPVS